MSEKIQKVLSTFGYGSRREIEGWIEQGHIQVNGKLAKIGDRMEITDTISIKGRRIVLNLVAQAAPKVLIYYKPEGIVCTRHDPEGRETVFKKLPPLRGARWIMVGRLDFNTSGLLLFTTDGALANALMHPRQQIDREYAVRIYGTLSDEQMTLLETGVPLEDGPAAFKKISDEGGEGQNHWYHATITEGRNREIRRMFEYCDVLVSRLIRIRYGCVPLPTTLSRGQMCDLPLPQIKTLYQQAGLPIPPSLEAPQMAKPVTKARAPSHSRRAH